MLVARIVHACGYGGQGQAQKEYEGEQKCRGVLGFGASELLHGYCDCEMERGNRASILVGCWRGMENLSCFWNDKSAQGAEPGALNGGVVERERERERFGIMLLHQGAFRYKFRGLL